MNLNRPETSQILIDKFSEIVDSQDVKGFNKYGTTIDEAKDEEYNWMEMASEEVADLFKYLIKEISALRTLLQLSRKENRETKRLLRYRRVMELYKENLELAQENKKLKDLLNNR